MGWLDSSSNGILRLCMTEQQVEMLRKQIPAFATICQILVDMYTRIIPQQDPLLALQGMRYGNLYSDPYASSSHKITTRQRWTPTPTQLQILEKYFNEGIGTPSKQEIQEITSELAQHGQIAEMNVYNWFQNRRARSKRKRQSSVQQSKMESAAVTKTRGQQAKKAKSSVSPSRDNAITQSDGLLLERPEINSNLQPAYFVDPSVVLSDDESEMIVQSSLFNNMIINQGTVTEGSFDFSDAEHYY